MILFTQPSLRGVFLVVFVLLSAISRGQQFSKNVGGSTTNQLMGSTTAIHTQLLYNAADLGITAPGTIGRVYFKRGALGGNTLSNFQIRLGQITATSYGIFNTVFETGLQSVYSRTSVTIPSGATDTWYSFDISGFAYDPSLQLVVDITFSSSTNVGFTNASSVAGTAFGGRRKLFTNNTTSPTGTTSTDWPDFGLDMAPENDECSGALVLSPGIGCMYSQEGNTFAASQSLPGVTCTGSLSMNPDDDVWYRFEASGQGDTISVSAVDAAFDAVVDVYNGCQGGVRVACADATTTGGSEVIRMPNLAAGEIYYVRVYSFDTFKGKFRICLRNKNNPCITPKPTIKLSTTETVTNGSVLLRVNGSGAGFVQWQQSNDYGNTWADLQGHTDIKDTLVITDNVTDTLFFRARVTLGNCLEAYSDTAKVAIRCATPILLPGGTGNDYITQIKLNEIDNASTFDPLRGGYQDFRGLVANLCQNSTADLTITQNLAATLNNRLVWIDFNQDGDFDDQGEKVYAGSRVAGASVTVPISVPKNALPGLTTMRVIIFNDIESQAGNTACEAGNYFFGEIEEYSIRIHTLTRADAGITGLNCGNTVTLTANTIPDGLGTWSVDVGSATFADVNDPTTTASGLATGINVLRWSASNAFCPSNSDTVVITVVQPFLANAGTDQVVCTTAVSLSGNQGPVGSTMQWNNISGIGFLSTFGSSAFYFPPTTGSYKLEYTVLVPGCPISRDTVVATFQANPSSAQPGSAQTVCGTTATMNATAPTIGTGQWSVVSGSGVFANASDPNTTVTGLSAGVNRFRWTVSNNPCTPNSATVDITSSTPVQANAGTDMVVCTTFVTVTGNAGPVGSTYSWSKISGVGNLTPTSGPSAFYSGIGSGTSVLRFGLTVPGCPTTFDTMSVTNVTQNEPNAGGNQTVCGTSVTLQGSVPSFGSGKWSVVSGAGTFANDTDPNTTVSGLQSGANIFRWTYVNVPCPSDFDDVTITSVTPVQANAGTDQVVCTTSVSVSGNTGPTGTVYGWTKISGTGNLASFGGASAFYSGMGVGTSALQFSLTVPGCPASLDTVLVTRNSDPGNADAGPDQVICATSTTLVGNTPIAGSGRWKKVSGAGTIANATSASTVVTGLQAGTISTFRWIVSNNPCPSDSDDVSIAVNAPVTPDAGTDQTLCATTATLSGTPKPTAFPIIINNGTALIVIRPSVLWTRATGSSSITTPDSNITEVTALSPGENRFRYSVFIPACGTQTDSVSVIRVQPPSTSNAGSDQTVCGTGATLNATNPLRGTGKWTVISGSGLFVNDADPKSAVSGLSPGGNTFRWTVSNAPCASSSDQVLITSNTPASSNAGSDQIICSSTASLSGNTPPTGASVRWNLVSGSGIIATPTTSSTAVSVLGVGVNSFEYVVSVPGCPDAKDTVLVTRVAPALKSNAGPDQTICSNSVIMNADPASAGIGTWTRISGTGNIAEPNNPASLITGLSLGDNVFRWTITNLPCPADFSDVTITVVSPVGVYAGPDVSVCSTAVVLNADTAGLNGGFWTVLTGSGTISPFNSGKTAVINGLTPGVNEFEYTTTLLCGTQRDTVRVTRFVNPVANAGTDQNVCATSTSLNASAPANGAGRWSRVSGSGTVQNPANRNSVVTGLGVGNNVFKWKVSNAPCPADSDLVLVTRTAPIVADAGPDQTLTTNSTSLAAGNPTGTWNVVLGTGAVASPSNPNSSVTGLSLGVNKIVWTVTNPPCPDATDTVQIIVNEVASPCSQVTVTALAAGNLDANVRVQFIPPLSIQSYRVNFDDATLSPAALDPGEFPHTYSAPGVYNVCGEFSYQNALGNLTSCQVCDTVNIPVPFNPCDSFKVNTSVIKSITTSPLGWVYDFNTTLDFVDGTISQTRFSINGGPLLDVNNYGPGNNREFSYVVLPSTVNLCVYGYFTNLAGQKDSCEVCRQFNLPPPPVCDFFDLVTGMKCANDPGMKVVFSGQAPVDSYIIRFGDGKTYSGAESGDSVVHHYSLPGRYIVCATGYYNNGTDSCQVCDTVNIPALPNAGADQQRCSASATLSGNAQPTGWTSTWTRISGAGSVTNPNSSSTLVSGLAVGGNQFVYTFSNAGCPSVSDTVAVVRVAPITASAGSDQSIFSTSTSLSAGNPSGTWTLFTGSGVVEEPSNPNSMVNGLSLGVNQFIWTVTNAPCPVSRDTVKITVSPLSNPCSQVSLVAQSGAGLTGNVAVTYPDASSIQTYRIDYGDATQSGNQDNPTSLSHDFQAAGVYNVCGRFYFTNELQQPDSCEVCDTVRVLQPVNPCDSLTIISGSATKTVVTDPADASGWYYSFSTAFSFPAGYFTQVGFTSTDIGTGKLVVSPTATSAEINLTLKPGSKTICFKGYFVNPQGGLDSCVQCRDFNFDFPPVCDFFKHRVQKQCGGKASVVVVYSPQSPVSSFVTDFGDGNLHVGDVNGDSVNHTYAAPGQYLICSKGFYNQGLDSCVVCDTITIPAGPNAGSDQLICRDSTTLSGNTPPAGYTAFWSRISGTGTPDLPDSPSTPVSGIGEGTSVFVYQFFSQTCPALSDTVKVTREQAPSAAQAGADQTVCADSTLLIATEPTVGTGIWTLVSGAGAIVNPGSGQTKVTGLLPGDNVFRYSVSNGICPTSADEVTVKFIPLLANAGPDQIACNNQFTMEAVPPPTGATGLWTLVNGAGNLTNAGLPSTTVTSVGAGENKLVWTLSVSGCPFSSSDTVLLTRYEPVEPAIAGPDQVLCTSTAQLAAQEVNIGTGEWSVFTGSGTFFNPQNPQTTIANLAIGVNTLIWTVSNGTCPVSRDTVTITVNEPIGISAGFDQLSCNSTATLEGSFLGVGVKAQDDPVVLWTIFSGSGVIADPASLVTTVSNLGVGENVFVLSASVPGCGTVTDTVIKMREPATQQALAGVDQLGCDTVFHVSGNLPAEHSGEWSLLSGAGTIESPASPTTAIRGLAAGINQFVWTLSTLCGTSSDTVALVFQPILAQAGDDKTVCSDSTTLGALGIGSWKRLSGSGTFSNSTSPATRVFGLAMGPNVFQWKVESLGCLSDSDQVVISYQPPVQANAGSDDTVYVDSTTLIANDFEPGSGSWTRILGTSSIDNPSSAITQVRNLTPGLNKFVWSITNQPCDDSKDASTGIVTMDTVSIYYFIPIAANAGTDGTSCTDSSSVSGNSPGQGIGFWTVAGGPATVESPQSENSAVHNLAPGDNFFVWTILIPGLEPSHDTVNIHRYLPAVADAGPDQNLCNPAVVTLSAAPDPENRSGSWFLVSGCGFIASSTSRTTTVTGICDGENVFRWKTFDPLCNDATGGPTDEVTITVTLPEEANAGADQEICGDSATLEALAPVNGAGTWTLVSGSGSIDDPSNPATEVHTVGIGENRFAWTVVTGSCPAQSDTVLVTRSSPTIQAQAGIDQVVCGDQATLQGNAPGAGSGTWQHIAGTGILSVPEDSVTTVTNLSAGLNVFTWTIFNGTCGQSTDTVNITVNQPAVAEAGTDTTVCTSAYVLQATAASGQASGIWSVASGSGSVSNPSQPNSSVSNLSVGVNKLVWTVTVPGCTAVQDTLYITRSTLPAPVFAGVDTAVCGSLVTLNAAIPQVGQGTWSVISGTAQFLDIHEPKTSVSGLSAGSNTLVWTVENFPCPLSKDTIVVTSNQSLAANAGLSFIACSDTGSLHADLPAGSATGSWLVEQGSAIIANPVAANTAVSNLSSGLNVFRWTVSVPTCPDVSDTVGIFRLDNTLHIGNDTTLCVGDSLQLTVPPGYTGFIWSTGELTPSIWLHGADTVVLSVNTQQNCTFTDTIRVQLGICDAVRPVLAAGFHVGLQPNPASSQVYLAIQSREQKTIQLALYDALGKEAIPASQLQVTSENKIPIDVHQLPNGVYTIRLIGDQVYWTQKFVVSH